MAMTDTAGRNPPAMPPGRELDALVAEQVMGFPHREWDVETRCAQCGGEMRYCGARAWCYDEHEWRYSPYLEYSTEWDAMRLVVERLVAQGYGVEMSIGLNGPGAFCIVTPPDGVQPSDWSETKGETLPHAVSLAALAARKAVTSAQQGAEASHVEADRA